MSSPFPWGPLGIDKTSDTKAIRSAYAAKLKALNLDEEVAAYAELRNARDFALRQAKAANAPVVSDDGRLLDDGIFDGGLNGGELSGVNFTDPNFAGPELSGNQMAGNLNEGISFGPEGDFGDGPSPKPDPEAEASKERADRFLDAIFPSGKQSEEPLSDEEYQQAASAMRDIISEAQNADIGKQQSIQDWIAHYLADAWPRSSVLVVEAGQAFHWSANEGEIGENPAIAFLNNRLAGIAFMEELEHPGHPLNKAWNELQKPGRKPALFKVPFAGPRYEDFVTLINTVRGHYPELEDYLEPERVESWEAGESSGSIWSQPIVIMIGVALVIGVISNMGGSDRKTAQEILDPQIVALNLWSDEQKTDFIEELFGPTQPGDMEYLTDSGAKFWQAARSYTVLNYDEEMDEYARKNLTKSLRSMTQIQSQTADFDQLIAIKQVKMELMMAARAQAGTEGCIMMLQRAQLPENVTVSPALRDKERKIARSMLYAGNFDEIATSSPARDATIPGDIWQVAVAKSGLSQSSAEEAAMGRGPDKAWCDFKLALAAEVLRRPGKVSLDLLHIQ